MRNEACSFVPDQEPSSWPHFATEYITTLVLLVEAFKCPHALQIWLTICLWHLSLCGESLRPNPEMKPGNQHDIYIAVAAVATFRLFSVDGASQWTCLH